MLPKRMAFVDVETSGSQAHIDRIIEIGVVRVEDGKIVGKLDTLINPNALIPWFITRITGISENDLLEAPEFKDIQKNLDELLEGTTFIAHNVLFDYSFVEGEYKRISKSFHLPHICTVRLSRKLYPQYRRHNLDVVSRRHGIQINNRHRAFDDAFALWEFFQAVQTKFDEKILEDALQTLIQLPPKPTNFSKTQMFLVND